MPKLPKRPLLAALALSLLLCVAAIIPAQAQEGRSSGRFNHTDIARAEEVIKEYVHEHFGWNEDVYGVYIHSKRPSYTDEGHIIRFTVYYRDDYHLTSREAFESGTAQLGGGKSFRVIFDMFKMEVVRRLHFQ